MSQNRCEVGDPLYNKANDPPLGDWLEFAGVENEGLENDGVEQEQTYILHPMKNFYVYDIIIVSSINLKTYIIPHLELYVLKIW